MSYHIKWFTLVELMVSISIFFIMSLATYVSYSHVHKKSLLNQWVKEITKTIYEARNLAINGIDSGSGNISIWAYFDNETQETQSRIVFFSYPHSFTWSQIIPEETDKILLYKEIQLPDGVRLESVAWKNKFLMYFSAPEGRWEYYFWSESNEKQVYTWAVLPLLVSYKNAISPSLQKEIKYYTQGYIADY